MTILKGKKILIVGVANKNSIAAGIAESMNDFGAEIALSYQSEKLKSRVEALAENWNCSLLTECDVSDDSAINETFKNIKDKWGHLDGVVHAVGFAPGNELDGNFIDASTREGFAIAHDISVFSFIALAKASRELMADRSSSLLSKL